MALEYEQLNKVNELTLQIQALRKQWGEKFGYLKSIGAAVHGNSEMVALEMNIAGIEQQLRDQTGVMLRIDLVPPQFRTFAEQRAQIAQIRNKAQEHITNVLNGSILAYSREERAIIDASAQELTSQGIFYVCVFSGPRGVIAVKGGEGQVHSDIRERVWGSSDAGSVRPPSASGILYTIAGKPFIVLDGDQQTLWPSAAYGKEKMALTTSLLSIEDPTLDNVKDVYGSSSELLHFSSPIEAVILNNNLEPLMLKQNNMEERVKKDSLWH